MWVGNTECRVPRLGWEDLGAGIWSLLRFQMRMGYDVDIDDEEREVEERLYRHFSVSFDGSKRDRRLDFPCLLEI